MIAFALPFAQTQTPSVNVGAYTAYLVIAFFISMIIAFASGKLVQESGQSFWLGFLLGFFCGIFGLLVAVALYFTSDRRRPRQINPTEHYGYGSPILPPSSPYEMDYGGGVCAQCHAPLSPGSEFCPNCGNYAANQPAQPYPPQPYAQQPYPPQPYPQQPYPPQQYAQQPYPQQPYGVPPAGVPAAPPEPGMQPQAGTMKVCPLCMGKAPASAPNCPNCGTELSGTSAW